MAFLWLINGGDPNHSPTGMILQVVVIERQQPQEVAGTIRTVQSDWQNICGKFTMNAN